MATEKPPSPPKPQPTHGQPLARPGARPASLETTEGQLDAGDISLIRSMLGRTPTERLEHLQDFADGVMALRNGRVDRQ